MADKDKQKYYWLKLDRNFFEKYKIKSLLSEKNGEKFLKIYQQLMCECLNFVDENSNGILRFSKQRAYEINELAYVINVRPKELQEALKVLINKELIELLEDGTIVIFDMNVGSITGQTLRKKGGNNVVEITEELPNENGKKVVKPTLDIRDKSIDIRYKNIDDDNNNILRWLEAGYDNEVNECKDILNEHYNPTLTYEYQFNKIMNVLTNEQIKNKKGYIYSLQEKGEL